MLPKDARKNFAKEFTDKAPAKVLTHIVEFNERAEKFHAKKPKKAPVTQCTKIFQESTYEDLLRRNATKNPFEKTRGINICGRANKKTSTKVNMQKTSAKKGHRKSPQNRDQGKRSVKERTKKPLQRAQVKSCCKRAHRGHLWKSVQKKPLLASALEKAL